MLLLEGNKRSSLSFEPFQQIKKHRHFLASASTISFFALGMLSLTLGSFPYSNIVAYSCFGLSGGTCGAYVLLTLILALHKNKKLAPNMNEDAFLAHPFMKALFGDKDPKMLFKHSSDYVSFESTQVLFKPERSYGQLKNGWFLLLPKGNSEYYLLLAAKHETVWFWYLQDETSDTPLIRFLDVQIPQDLDQNESFGQLKACIDGLS